MLRGLGIVAALLMNLSLGLAAEAPEKKAPVYATFKTSMGDIVVLLLDDKAPKTVANFVGLASGTREWLDPKSGEKVKRPLYNGTIFHRVIPGFMIQGGDPVGNGTGGPGYRFEDECPPGGPKFDKPGLLAMANAGPNTNGSQFFVTVAKTPWLNGKHTIFGEVTEGMDIVTSISTVDRDASDRPTEDIVIERVEIDSAE